MKKTEILFDSLENVGHVITNLQSDGLYLSAGFQNIRFDILCQNSRKIQASFTD